MARYRNSGFIVDVRESMGDAVFAVRAVCLIYGGGTGEPISPIVRNRYGQGGY